MGLKRTPETTEYGLVLQPSPEELEYLRLFQVPKKRPDMVERHHLYWPRSLYFESKLATDFREHYFNSMWILHEDHTSIHKKYDGVPIPPEDVMDAFLDEAELLVELGICVRGVEMIDKAIYEDRISHLSIAEENRQQKIEIINTTIELVDHFEAMPAHLARMAISQLTNIPVAA